MNARRLLLETSSVLVGLIGILLLSGANPAANTGQKANTSMSGPYVHENLTVFLIRGPDQLKGKSYLTLQEALERKLVVVHETGNVNQLSIENLSPGEDVYIQSGDIVKGGKQDRTIAMDFIVPPKSGQMPIDAFCVEHGRWRQRGSESAMAFASSNNSLAGRELKLAAKQQADQSAVWEQAAASQQKLAQNAGAVVSAQSPSSLELSLESPAVQQHTEDYIKALQPIIEGKNDVIGYAFAINGKINSADVYASHALFTKLWPKLLGSSAVEALSDRANQKKPPKVTADQVTAFIASAQAGKQAKKDVTPRVELLTRETEAAIDFDTRDRSAGDATIHQNVVSKK